MTCVNNINKHLIAGRSDAMDINAPIVNVEMTILDNNVGATGFIRWSRNCTLTHDTVGCCQALLVHLFISRVRRCFILYTMCA